MTEVPASDEPLVARSNYKIWIPKDTPLLRCIFAINMRAACEHLFYRDTEWRSLAARTHSAIMFCEFEAKGVQGNGYGRSMLQACSQFATDLGFGHKTDDAHESQVLVIKACWGGRSLGHNFLPPSVGRYPKPLTPGDPGFYYHEILRIVKEVAENMGTYFPDYKGQGMEIAGLCFHHGWNDQSEETVEKVSKENRPRMAASQAIGEPADHH